MRRMIDAKLYILLVLIIMFLLLLANSGSVNGKTKNPGQNVPAFVMETGESFRNTADIRNEPSDPGFSAAAYTTPLAFALRQSAVQKVRAVKPL